MCAQCLARAWRVRPVRWVEPPERSTRGSGFRHVRRRTAKPSNDACSRATRQTTVAILSARRESASVLSAHGQHRQTTCRTVKRRVVPSNDVSAVCRFFDGRCEQFAHAKRRFRRPRKNQLDASFKLLFQLGVTRARGASERGEFGRPPWKMYQSVTESGATARHYRGLAGRTAASLHTR